MNGYECTKKVLNKRKRPLLFLRMAKAKEICTKMSTCMGIMKHDCSRRLTRMYLCESGEDDLKRTKQKPSCVSMKVPGMHNLIFLCYLIHLKSIALIHHK